MRHGRKPRREPGPEPGPEPVESPVGPQPVVTDDLPSTQLSLATLEEPAEILVRFATDEPGHRSEETGSAEEGPAAETIEPAARADPAATTDAAATTDVTTTSAAGAFDTDNPRTESATSVEPAVPELTAEPEPYRAVPPASIEDPTLQMRLARIHLRTGSPTMARAQLESLAGRDLLDARGTLDLAEARWRMGDIHGAGDAAVAYLSANGGEALGFIIAAEAATLAGRHAEARRDMEQALLRTLTSLDSVYAGIPRKALFTATAWATTPVPAKSRSASVAETPAGTSEQVGAPQAVENGAENPTEPDAGGPIAAELVAAESVTAVEPAPETTEAGPEVADSTPGAESEVPQVASAPAVDPVRLQAATDISAGTRLLETGDPLMAALHFGLALRMTGDSAPAVLAAIGDRRDLPLELVRGDALRMLGLESDAGAAYMSVATALSAARTAPDGLAKAPAEAPTPPAATEPAVHELAPEALGATPEASTEVAREAMPEETTQAAEDAAPAPASEQAAEAAEKSLEAPQPVDLPPISWSD